MEEKLYRTIHLDNHQDLNIYDNSRKVAMDSWQIRLSIRMNIKVEAELFSCQPDLTVNIDDVKKKVGNEVIYEVKLERNFIDDGEKDDVLESMISSYLSTNLHYISKDIFPGKFILKEFVSKNKYFRA